MMIVRNDGGRKAAGFEGSAGDCVARSIAIVTGRPYADVYAELADVNARTKLTKRRKAKAAGTRSARNGVYTNAKPFQDYMKQQGFRWVATMGIGTGCKVHLAPGELPMGRIIARVSKHYVAVLDGVIHDTYDCSRGGTRCVHGYWTK
jgi:hypothetical protein